MEKATTKKKQTSNYYCLFGHGCDSTFVCFFSFFSCLFGCLFGWLVGFFFEMTIKINIKDWEFTDSSGDSVTTGYYTQILCARLNYGFSSCGIYLNGIIVFGIYGLIMYFMIKSNKNQIISNVNLCCSKNGAFTTCMALILGILTLVVLFVGCSDLFAWGQSGYFSYTGYSQDLPIIAMFLYINYCLWLIYLARNIDKINQIKDNQTYEPVV